jgi:predicted nucleic acid-binding protein
LVAIFRSSQPDHQACVDCLKDLRLPLLTCWPVITEACYLLRHRPEQVKSLLDGFQTGLLELLPLTESDIPRVQSIIDRFADQSFQLADACMMHLAERENIQKVFTLDRRDFSVFRTADDRALEILPNPGI